MSKRKYTQLKTVVDLILAMHQDGMTLRDISNELGLSHKQMRNWSYRYNCEKKNLLKGIAPKSKGRLRKDGLPPRQDAQKELEQLRMENKLLLAPKLIITKQGKKTAGFKHKKENSANETVTYKIGGTF